MSKDSKHGLQTCVWDLPFSYRSLGFQFQFCKALFDFALSLMIDTLTKEQSRQASNLMRHTLTLSEKLPLSPS